MLVFGPASCPQLLLTKIYPRSVYPESYKCQKQLCTRCVSEWLVKYVPQPSTMWPESRERESHQAHYTLVCPKAGGSRRHGQPSSLLGA